MDRQLSCEETPMGHTGVDIDARPLPASASAAPAASFPFLPRRGEEAEGPADLDDAARSSAADATALLAHRIRCERKSCESRLHMDRIATYQTRRAELIHRIHTFCHLANYGVDTLVLIISLLDKFMASFVFEQALGQRPDLAEVRVLPVGVVAAVLLGSKILEPCQHLLQTITANVAACAGPSVLGHGVLAQSWRDAVLHVEGCLLRECGYTPVALSPFPLLEALYDKTAVSGLMSDEARRAVFESATNIMVRHLSTGSNLGLLPSVFAAACLMAGAAAQNEPLAAQALTQKILEVALPAETMRNVLAVPFVSKILETARIQKPTPLIITPSGSELCLSNMGPHSDCGEPGKTPSFIHTPDPEGPEPQHRSSSPASRHHAWARDTGKSKPRHCGGTRTAAARGPVVEAPTPCGSLSDMAGAVFPSFPEAASDLESDLSDVEARPEAADGNCGQSPAQGRPQSGWKRKACEPGPQLGAEAVPAGSKSPGYSEQGCKRARGTSTGVISNC